MKKILPIIFVLSYCITYAQFTIAEKSTDWIQISKYEGGLVLYKKENLLKIKLKDVRSEKGINSVLQPSRTVFDDIYKEQKNANDGVKKGYYEIILSADGSTTEDLFSVIDTHFKNKIIEEVTLNFPEGNLYLKFYKDLFQILVSVGLQNNDMVIYTDGYSLAGIKNVFGKNKK